jgi:hypothetical protein
MAANSGLWKNIHGRIGAGRNFQNSEASEAASIAIRGGNRNGADHRRTVRGDSISANVTLAQRHYCPFLLKMLPVEHQRNPSAKGIGGRELQVQLPVVAKDQSVRINLYWVSFRAKSKAPVTSRAFLCPRDDTEYAPIEMETSAGGSATATDAV